MRCVPEVLFVLLIFSMPASAQDKTPFGDQLSRDLAPPVPPAPPRLAGLPRLDLPVYLKAGSPVCGDPASAGTVLFGLQNRNEAQRREFLRLHHCAQSDNEIVVGVVEPKQVDYDYRIQMQFGVVEIRWRTSDGGEDRGWAAISALHNDDAAPKSAETEEASICIQTIKTHGFLSRAQFQCRYTKYANSMMDAARLCYGKLSDADRKEALRAGMATFDLNEREKGHEALCQDILIKFPKTVAR
jgi:hypothetical protein